MSREVCAFLRYKRLQEAKKLLDEVLAMKRPVPFRRSVMDLGHKPGIGPGRYPIKACGEILRLLKSVEANAQAKGLNTSRLKIVHLVANKAPEPMHPGRHRRSFKRTHIEVIVKEVKESAQIKKRAEKKEEKASVKK